VTTRPCHNCVLCGKMDCGNYLKPNYACKNPITIQCDKCKAAGFKLQYFQDSNFANGSLAMCCIQVPLFRELIRKLCVCLLVTKIQNVSRVHILSHFMTFWLWRNFSPFF
jgi:hypothetical protein